MSDVNFIPYIEKIDPVTVAEWRHALELMGVTDSEALASQLAKNFPNFKVNKADVVAMAYVRAKTAGYDEPDYEQIVDAIPVAYEEHLLFDPDEIGSNDSGRRRILDWICDDMRKEIMVVANYTNLLRINERGNLTHEQSSMLDRVRARCEELMDLTSELSDVDLIDFLKLEEGRLTLNEELIYPSQFLKELSAEVTAAEDYYCSHIHHDLPSVMSPIRADRSRLWQAMQNLLKKALESTRVGREFVISARETPDSLVIQFREDGSVITLRDPVEARETEARRKGSRYPELRVALAKHLLEAHGGRVRIQDETNGDFVAEATIPKK